MDENQDMKRFADRLWEYFRPKIEELTRSSIWYFRAQVTKEAANGKITVQRPFDEEIALPYVSSMANAAVGSQVTVFVFGSSLTNAVICGNGSLSILGGSPSSGGGSGDAENAVLYVAQILSSEQQAQARSNIGAISSDALSGKQDTIDVAGLLKGDGNGVVTAAVPGTDYLQTAPVTSVDGKTGAVDLSDSYATPEQLAEKQPKIMVDGVLEGDGKGNVQAAVTLEGTLVDYSGGGSGTTDYDELENRPQINSVVLTGNKTSKDLSLYGHGNPPPYPVASVNGKVGVVNLTASDVGAISSLPIASSTQLGGIKVGAGLSITTNGTLSATGGGTADAVAWDNVLDTPTTVEGYGITDAKIQNGVITLGGTSLTPYTSSNTPPYPVKSVDGKTGAVVLYDLKYTAQSLTSSQKQQARSNIDVPATDEVLLLEDTVAASYINMSNTISVGSLLKVTSVDANGNPTALAGAIPGTDYMPAVPVTASDNGKTLKVVNGVWTAST